SGTRAAMEGFFRDARIAPPRVMESTSNETIKQAVIANMGLAFLSLHTVGLELDHGLVSVLDVVGLPLVRRWHIVHLQGKPLSPAAEAMRYFVLEHGEALIRAQFGAATREADVARAATPAVADPPRQPTRARARAAATAARTAATPARRSRSSASGTR
ncbi:MAG: LysR substrate-binding domain-containing protein, partial [Burkholderiaceae bacterium]|nr:LysR substrate-binding domain-containing protein [Burkholderiaceae bacterium]